MDLLSAKFTLNITYFVLHGDTVVLHGDTIVLHGETMVLHNDVMVSQIQIFNTQTRYVYRIYGVFFLSRLLRTAVLTFRFIPGLAVHTMTDLRNSCGGWTASCGKAISDCTCVPLTKHRSMYSKRASGLSGLSCLMEAMLKYIARVYSPKVLQLPAISNGSK